MLILIFDMDKFSKVAHIHKTYDTIGHSKKLRDTLYMTLVLDPNMEQIGTIMKRAMGRMIQLWIYYTSEMMKIG
jgi:hypothetical protein